jgi:hypothetical protein
MNNTEVALSIVVVVPVVAATICFVRYLCRSCVVLA